MCVTVDLNRNGAVRERRRAAVTTRMPTKANVVGPYVTPIESAVSDDKHRGNTGLLTDFRS